MVQRILAPLACAILVSGAHAEAPLLAAIYADHAVLQRDKPIEVWGTAQPGEQVTVSLAGVTRAAQADGNGHWAATLPALSAAGPYVLTARSPTRSQQVSDLLVGDVWLCSGQSNMEWKVRNALNAQSEVQHSANDSIRHVAIPRFAATTPRQDFPFELQWKVAGPQTTGDFSAVCYYFARELQKTTRVPQGLINSSWGGTRIETWLSAATLRQLGGNDPALDLLAEYGRDLPMASRHWGESWEKWWSAQAATRGVKPWLAGGNNGEWRPAPEPLTQWESWDAPAFAEYDGQLWYRARVKLSAAQARQSAQLVLGVIDDVDVVWVNGQPMGSGFGENPRSYAVPAKLLKAGDNTVVVNVFDMWGSGGMHGAPAQFALQFADGSSAALSGWQYQSPPAGLETPRAPWEPIAGINILYNGMISPLGKYGLRGVAWYQGEANGSLADASKYQQQLQALFTDWRRQFDAPLPFFVVQLANYNKLAPAPVDSGWARLRDAQRRAVTEDGNAGLAVTLDIGNRDDIHPTNKLDVGKRLARAARHVVFGERISASGGAPRSARRETGGVAVTLADYDGDLIVIGARDPAGFELCGDDQASCHFVRASLQSGGVVRLEDLAPEKATRVRFCWADAPLCNLFDTEGLPVGPFELTVN